MRTAVYYIGLAFLFTHELDAVRHSEWRLLVVLRGLPDDWAYSVFVILHVPLFAAILWLSEHGNVVVRLRFRASAAAFLVVHAGLHLLLSASPEYEFRGLLSDALIYSAAAFGIAYIALGFRSPRGAPAK